MLIQVSVNNIESVEQGEAILKKWRYHLDEDQSRVVIERDVDGLLIRIAGFHPWADEFGDDDEECCCDDEECCGKNSPDEGCCCHHGEGDEPSGEEEENEGSEEGEEDVETIYLGQALFAPAEEQAHVLAEELLDDDYVGTVTIWQDGREIADAESLKVLPENVRKETVTAVEELGDVEAYLSLREVMGLHD